ncbi:hypothetical protein Gotur_022910 [Gossypium turneri]
MLKSTIIPPSKKSLLSKEALKKQVPHPQLLRWAEWFSRYCFDVKHIQGKTNVLADIFSRPTIKPAESFMFQPSSSSKSKGKKKTSQNPPSPSSIPCQPNSHPDHPPEVLNLIVEKSHNTSCKMARQPN